MSRIRLKHEATAFYLRRRKYCGVTTFENWWWDKKEHKWIDGNRVWDLSGTSSHAPIFSIRKFKKMLVTAPKGVRFILCSRYVNADCRGVGLGKK